MSRYLRVFGIAFFLLAALASPLGVRADAPVPLAECTATVQQLTGTIQTVQFSAAASGGYPPYTYYWYVSDGTSSNVASFTHTFSAPGSYHWNLHVTDIEYDYCDLSGDINVQPCSLDCAATAPSSGQVGTPVAFQSVAVYPYCPGSVSYAWTFGDGGTSSLQRPTHTYTAAGEYSWSLTVSLNEATTCTKSGVITIESTCKLTCAATVPATGTTGSPVSFQSSATATDCPGPIQYRWDFGNGYSSTQQNTTYAYPAAGTYTWSLTVTSGTATCWQTGTITISASCSITCSASASPTSGNAPLSVQFAGSATASGCTGAVAYDWDFGDQSGHSSLQSPTHVYTSPGTYNWTMVASAGSTQCRKTGTVTVGGNPGALYGTVVISGVGAVQRLDGPGISDASVTARSSSGQSYEAPIEAGAFIFQDLPSGTYELQAKFTYADHIMYDAYDSDVGDYGCPAPQGGEIAKSAASASTSVNVPASAAVVITFPPPIVMLHGFAGCYQKWYSEDSGSENFWDNFSRSQGFITFTPNYTWWGSDDWWTYRAQQIYDQVGLDLADLCQTSAETGPSPPPWVILGYDMGGLVARVLTGGPYRPTPLVHSVQQVFLLGAMNSGTDLLVGGSWNSPISTEAVIQSFNPLFPDFGDKTRLVYAIGGDDGWWDLPNSDGRVPIYSAFDIVQLACSPAAWGPPTCKPYAAILFENGSGHIFHYDHYGLGSPASTAEILEQVILPLVQEGPTQRAALENVPVDPESPAGAIIWGTTNRTTNTVSDNLAAFALTENAQAYDFTISATDGYAVVVFVFSGSADFEVVDPAGISHPLLPEYGYTYLELNPEPGAYKLLVTPGSSGVSFSASFQEDGTFGANGYATLGNYHPGAQAHLRLDMAGDLTGMVVSDAVAALYSPQGDLIRSVTLTDEQAGSTGDGSFGGYTDSPSTPGAYPLWFRVRGTYQGVPFQRVSLSTLNVIPTTHLFTGTFSDNAAYPNPAGQYQGLQATVRANLPSQGYFVISADLYDASGNFLDHAAASDRVSAAGPHDFVLGFSLLAARCVQFGKPFYVTGLLLEDGKSLDTLDAWLDPVATRTYQSGAFACLPGAPQPAVKTVQPDEGVQGQTLSLFVSGTSFKPGATLTFDSGISVVQSNVVSTSAISATVAVQPGAQLGPHSATVTNADGSSGTLSSAFLVKQGQPPYVAIQEPSDGSEISGVFKVSAAASDDVRVVGVGFSLDNGTQTDKSAFPFATTFDASTLANGAHRITAIAKDSSGLTTQTSITVYKNPPKVASATGGGSPFKIKLDGANFAPGASVFIGSDATPWSDAKVKGSTLVVLKGGNSLKARFPSGVPVRITVRNPDGGSGSCIYARP